MSEEQNPPPESPALKPVSRRPAARPTVRGKERLPFGVAELGSLSRLTNPGAGDPYQSGQRLWPD